MGQAARPRAPTALGGNAGNSQRRSYYADQNSAKLYLQPARARAGFLLPAKRAVAALSAACREPSSAALVDRCAVPVGARAPPARPAPARPGVAALHATMSRATSSSSRATRRPVRYQGSTTRPMPCSAPTPATPMFVRFATSTRTSFARSCARDRRARSCSSATPTSSWKDSAPWPSPIGGESWWR